MALNGLNTIPRNTCTGCGACKNICPEACVQMNVDEEGFNYPVINVSKCINCKKCVKICPVNSPLIPPNTTVSNVYAAWSLDYDTRYNSTSGGIFSELAGEVLYNGGSVAGAIYAKDQNIQHILIDKEEDLHLLRQSKYAQSDTGMVFNEIKHTLKSGRQVFFVGTPCQCAAIRKYIDQNDKMIVCDFICRGVNSPLVYKKYLQELEVKYNSKVKKIWFKNKRNGWDSFGTQIEFENGAIFFNSRDDDPFMFGYIRKGLNLYMRPSCGQCKFKGVNRLSDITLGDFWGIRPQNGDDTRNGVSAVMIHTKKGQELFEAITPYIYKEMRSKEDIEPYNRCLFESAKVIPNARSKFWELFKKSGFFKAINYFKDGVLND